MSSTRRNRPGHFLYLIAILISMSMASGRPLQAQDDVKDAFWRGQTSAPSSPVLKVPFRLTNGLILIEGEIDGQRGFFILDTGCPVLAVNAARSTVSGPVAAAATVTDSHGQATTQEVKSVNTLRWGPFTAQKLGAIAMDLRPLEGVVRELLPPDLHSLQFLGIIGIAQLEPFTTIFDYQAQQLTFISLDSAGRPLASWPGTAPAAQLPIIMLPGGTPGVRASLGDSTHTIEEVLELDSGNNAITALDSTILQRLGVTLQASDLGVASVVGKSTAQLRIGTLNRLAVGPMRLDNIRVQTAGVLRGTLGYEFLKERRLGMNFRSPTLYIWDGQK